MIFFSILLSQKKKKTFEMITQYRNKLNILFFVNDNSKQVILVKKMTTTDSDLTHPTN